MGKPSFSQGAKQRCDGGGVTVADRHSRFSIDLLCRTVVYVTKIVGEPSDYRQKSLYWLEIRRREPIILKELGCATTIVGGGDRSDQDCTHGAFCPLWYSVASSLKVNNSASSHDNRE